MTDFVDLTLDSDCEVELIEPKGDQGHRPSQTQRPAARAATANGTAVKPEPAPPAPYGAVGAGNAFGGAPDHRQGVPRQGPGQGKRKSAAPKKHVEGAQGVGRGSKRQRVEAALHGAIQGGGGSAATVLAGGGSSSGSGSGSGSGGAPAKPAGVEVEGDVDTGTDTGAAAAAGPGGTGVMQGEPGVGHASAVAHGQRHGGTADAVPLGPNVTPVRTGNLQPEATHARKQKQQSRKSTGQPHSSSQATGSQWGSAYKQQSILAFTQQTQNQDPGGLPPDRQPAHSPTPPPRAPAAHPAIVNTAPAQASPHTPAAAGDAQQPSTADKPSSLRRPTRLAQPTHQTPEPAAAPTPGVPAAGPREGAPAQPHAGAVGGSAWPSAGQGTAAAPGTEVRGSAAVHPHRQSASTRDAGAGTGAGANHAGRQGRGAAAGAAGGRGTAPGAGAGAGAGPAGDAGAAAGPGAGAAPHAAHPIMGTPRERHATLQELQRLDAQLDGGGVQLAGTSRASLQRFQVRGWGQGTLATLAAGLFIFVCRPASRVEGTLTWLGGYTGQERGTRRRKLWLMSLLQWQDIIWSQTG